METILIHLLSVDKPRVAGAYDFHFLHHLADDDANMLVVDRYALEAVHLLDFVHEVCLAGMFTQNVENIVGILAAVAEQFTGFHHIVVAHKEPPAHGNQMLVFLAEAVGYNNKALVLDVLADGNLARNHREHRGIFGLARLEKLPYPGQASRDVHGLGTLFENLGYGSAGLDNLSIFHVEVCPAGK